MDIKIKVYQITNLKNNKVYIGSTTLSMKKTQWYHKSHGTKFKNYKGQSRPLYKAIKKHGFYNFIYNVIGEFQSRNEAYEFKEACIEEFNLMNPKYGYNCTTGRLDKWKLNKETRERISEIQTGKVMPESWKIWLKNEIKNKPDKYKTLQKGYKHTKKARKNMRLGQLNSDYVPSEETKNKTSETMKRRWKEPEIIEKMKNRKRGIITEETRKKLSIANSGKNNPMYGRRKEDHPSYGTTMSEEQKKKIAIGRKKYIAKKKKEMLKVIKNRTEKKCKKCKKIKSLDMYGKNNARLDKLESWCIECERKRGRIKYYKNISPNKVRNRYGHLIKDVIK